MRKARGAATSGRSRRHVRESALPRKRGLRRLLSSFRALSLRRRAVIQLFGDRSHAC